MSGRGRYHGTGDAGVHRIKDPRRTPALSLLLGYGAMLPFAIGAAAVWLLAGEGARFVADLTLLWGAAILVFLAGVRRGVSFRTENGPTAAQVAMMLWLFLLGLAAPVALALPSFRTALGLLLAGYASLAVLDPLAARRGEVPLFFERLRPVQMLIPIVCLIAIGVR